MASKKNLVKRKFPYIDTFDHEGPTVFSATRKLTSGVFEHLVITSPLDVYQRVAFMQLILRGSVLNKYKAVLLDCKQSSNDLAGDKWNLGDLKGISTDDFWTWDKCDRITYDVDA